MARELRRINMNMPTDLVDRIDEYADRMSVNRSAAINVLCNLALDSQQAIVTMENLMLMIKEEQAKQGKK